MIRHALLLSLVVAATSSAQDGQVPDAIYLNSGALLGSHRMVSMGGAYTGIAEGIDGYPANLTVLAHRDPKNKLNLDFGFTFGWLDIALFDQQWRDLDNDEVADNAVSNQLQAGVMFQYKGAGVGGFWRTRYLSYCEIDTEDCRKNIAHTDRVNMLLNTYSGGFAFSLGQDNVLLGAGLTGVSAVLGHDQQTNAYGGLGLQFDALLRPQFIPIRIGGSIKTQMTAGFIGDKNNPPSVADGKGQVARIIVPATYSLGVSFKLGEGAEHYNRLSVNYLADLRRELGEEKAPKPLEEDAPTGRLLIALQLDIIAPTDPAVPTAYYSAQIYPGIPVIGQNTMYQPRLGLEIEAIRKRLRMRGGGYLEPSPFPDKSTRLHYTGGFELLMFHLVTDWSLTGSVDYARQYLNWGLSIGFWK